MQALSADTKDELAREPVAAGHCREALRAGLIAFGTHARTHVFRTQRSTVARLLWSLLDDRRERPIRKRESRRLTGARSYEIDLGELAHVRPPAPRSRCDRRMELRAAFLACGSLATPARGYHLEFVPPDGAAAERLLALMRAERFAPKSMPRAGRTVVYFKDIEAIVDVLAAIGASRAVLHLEDVRALKETKNRIRRLVNTEAANVDRAMSAAAAQREAIALVVDAHGLHGLSRPLREVAELRLEHPTETLAELGRRCRPVASKSTVNGRIAALLRLASSLGAPAR